MDVPDVRSRTRSEIQPVFVGDAKFADYRLDQPDADILAFVKGDRHNPARLEVDHPYVTPAGVGPFEAQVPEFPDDLLRFERDKPRHAPVRRL